jgi:hypothetical protein
VSALRDPRRMERGEVDYAGVHDPPGSPRWIIVRRSMMLNCLLDIHNNRETGAAIFEDVQAHGGWEHLRDLRGNPFRSFEEFCASPNGFGMPRQKIVERLKAQELAGAEGVAPARDARGGRPAKSEKVDNIHLPKGTSSARLVARLKRDAPEIAGRLASGEFRSARAAAIAAGLVVPLGAFERLMREWRSATKSERARFLREIRK